MKTQRILFISRSSLVAILADIDRKAAKIDKANGHYFATINITPGKRLNDGRIQHSNCDYEATDVF